MTDPQTPTNAPPAKPRERIRVATLVLYAFLLATICFVAYQVRLCVVRQSAPSRSTVMKVDVGARDVGQPFAPTTQSQPVSISGLVDTQPAFGDSLTVLKSDPGGFVPPAGAKTISDSGYEQRSPGQVQQQMEYQYPGELAAAKDHYVNLLTKAGYADIPERIDPKHPPRNPRDAVDLNFTKDLTHVSLVLRKAPGQVKMVRILIVTTNVVSQ
jgi:hypothetical protein